jgi:PAS domain S-box-containing protein
MSGMPQRLVLREGQLAAALGQLAEAVTVQLADGALAFANDAAVRLMGFDSLDELLQAGPAALARRYRILHPDGRPLGFEELPGRKVLSGQRPESLLVRWVDLRHGDQRWSRIRSTPLLDDDGALAGAINVIEDVTEAHEAEQARRLLDQAVRTLSSSLDYEETLQHVARLAVPDLADWCGVDVLDERGDVRQVAVAHVDPARARFARELRERYPVDMSRDDGVAGVMKHGSTELVQDIDDALLVQAAEDDEHLAALRAIGLHAALIVPLEAAGRVIGALSLVLSGEGRRFSPGDITLAQELGRRAGAAVHNARLFTERGEISHVLQASLVPGALPELPRWRTAVLFRAAGEANEVGGDFYDVQRLDDRRWLAVIGDVTGKGAAAAAVTPRVRHTVATAVALTGDAAPGLDLLDRVLGENPEQTAATVAVIVAEERDDGTTVATITCAGHPPPLLVREGRVEAVGAPGAMLGLREDAAARPRTEVVLRPGDALVLYTDGVTEATGEEGRFGVERLTAALAGPSGRPEVLVGRVVGALDAFADGRQADDVAVLALQRTR